MASRLSANEPLNGLRAPVNPQSTRPSVAKSNAPEGPLASRVSYARTDNGARAAENAALISQHVQSSHFSSGGVEVLQHPGARSTPNDMAGIQAENIRHCEAIKNKIARAATLPNAGRAQELLEVARSMKGLTKPQSTLLAEAVRSMAPKDFAWLFLALQNVGFDMNSLKDPLTDAVESKIKALDLEAIEFIVSHKDSVDLRDTPVVSPLNWRHARELLKERFEGLAASAAGPSCKVIVNGILNHDPEAISNAVDQAKAAYGSYQELAAKFENMSLPSFESALKNPSAIRLARVSIPCSLSLMAWYGT